MFPLSAPARKAAALLLAGMMFVPRGGAGEGVAPPPAALEIEGEWALPAAFQHAMDVRWASGASVLVVDIRGGVAELELPPEGGMAVPRRTLLAAGDSRRDGLWMPSRLGASESHLAAAAPVFSIAWQERWRGERLPPLLAFFDVVVDLDVHGDRLLLLGARREGRGERLGTGGVVWLGTPSAGGGLDALQPVYLSVKDNVAQKINDCGLLETGAVRFVDGDGSYLVVPGFSPGVHRYGPSGEREAFWDTASLGIDTDCDPGEQLREAIFRQAAARKGWINQRRVVDDILPLPGGPALLAREHRPSGLAWRLTRLLPEGGSASSELPLAGPSRGMRLKGDVRGQRVILLLYDPFDWKEEVTHPPRLYLGRVVPAAPRPDPRNDIPTPAGIARPGSEYSPRERAEVPHGHPNSPPRRPQNIPFGGLPHFASLPGGAPCP